LLCFRFSFLKIHMFDNEQLIHEKHELGFPRKLPPFYHFAKKRYLVISPYEIGKIFAIYIVGKISQKMMFAKFRVNEETLISRTNNYLEEPLTGTKMNCRYSCIPRSRLQRQGWCTQSHAQSSSPFLFPPWTAGSTRTCGARWSGRSHAHARPGASRTLAALGGAGSSPGPRPAAQTRCQYLRCGGRCPGPSSGLRCRRSPFLPPSPPLLLISTGIRPDESMASGPAEVDDGPGVLETLDSPEAGTAANMP